MELLQQFTQAKVLMTDNNRALPLPTLNFFTKVRINFTLHRPEAQYLNRTGGKDAIDINRTSSQYKIRI